MVDDLLSSITKPETPTWGIPKERVAVTRVTIDDVDVSAGSGALDWEYVRQYPYNDGGVVFLYFSVLTDTYVPPPDASLLNVEAQVIQGACCMASYWLTLSSCVAANIQLHTLRGYICGYLLVVIGWGLLEASARFIWQL